MAIKNIFNKFFSAEKKIKKIEEKINLALKENKIDSVVKFYCSGFSYLIKNEEFDTFVTFVNSFKAKITDYRLIEKKLTKKKIKESVSILVEKGNEQTAIEICMLFNYYQNAIVLLSKRGRVNDIISIMSN